MIGAELLVRSLVSHGVDTCFMNPGTSEMHFVATLDRVPEMDGVLTLFEGVATGAADGYARVAGRPAATLLHLGPGLGNGLANLHNARRAHSPVLNLVGDHALSHQAYDAPLQSDIGTIARNVSTFVRSSEAPERLPDDVAAALVAATGPPGAVATLILPADVMWTESDTVGLAPLTTGRPGAGAGNPPDETVVAAAAAGLRSGEPAALLIGGRACVGPTLDRVADLAARAGAKLLAETFPARLERGAGRPGVERLAYLAELVALQLDGIRHLVLVDAASPVSFFAYPGRPGDLVPPHCQVHRLAGPADDVETAVGALEALTDARGSAAPRQAGGVPALPMGALTPETVCQALGALLPEGAVVSDEGNTSGLWAAGATAGAPPHDWLCLTGGAIGQGLPVALGAAMAARERRVIALEADGSSMYTAQAWWTMAREGLDVTTILFNNHSYAVLNMELDRVGAVGAGARAREMLDLDNPSIEFAGLARAMGLQTSRAETAEDFAEQLDKALHTPGPNLVEAVLSPR